MKTIFVFILLSSVVSFAQFKGDETKDINIRSGIINNNPFSFIDMSKFSMGHSFEMSYSSFGNNGLALGVYTNKLGYEFNENLTFQLNTSFVNSPYNSFGDNFSKNINGIYIDSARLNYSPSEKFHIILEYSNSPLNYRYNYNRGFPFFNNGWRY